MIIVSLHLPKTAGTSFGNALRTHFIGRYKDDYHDTGLSKPTWQRRRAALRLGHVIARFGLGDIECVHGHFLPVKYLALKKRRGSIFVTWLRDPIERLLSHYNYWQRTYDKSTSAFYHRKIVEENWTLEEFCLSEVFQNIYAQYLWGFTLEDFDFIGISEFLEDDVRDFSSSYLSSGLQLDPRNASLSRNLSAQLDRGFLREVQNFHAIDIALYERALKMRLMRRISTLGLQ
ncbi:sulfotransferase family 2 domain-containing protein [Dyella psychrodurans]|uniref:Sulfotransferase family protein n=1 Tax=Dyella psychrodurans TaxID=1927960 RepID=A0A370WY51_9GAMM|nr:sulfotransferase family 2 domain-containing protein [Dyella psychrodurans]RDS80980.1 hypothetical protein DWU99_18175 [Dyella psychrodurans]